jgi:hypothetical protein
MFANKDTTEENNRQLDNRCILSQYLARIFKTLAPSPACNYENIDGSPQGRQKK